MQNTKNYPNNFNKRMETTNFNKRVESTAHEPKFHLKEPSVCKECGANYVDQRWSLADSDPSNTKHQRFRTAEIVTCPACKQIAEGVASGYLHMTGEFYQTHLEDIKHLLNNETERAMTNNPLSRIMKWEKDGDETIVYTTTEHLAQRLGHALEKAYGGNTKYSFSHENKLAHVWWERK